MFHLLSSQILILWYMNLMNNGQMDRGNENPTQHLPWWLRKTMKKPQSGWSASGFEPGTSRMWVSHGRLARWIKWRDCDVGETKEGLENELWHRWSNRRVGEWAVTYVKRRKGCRMSCNVSEATEGLENVLWRRWSDGKVGEWALLQPLRHFTYVTIH